MKKLTCLILALTSTASLAASPACYVGNRPGAMTFTLGGGYFFLDSQRQLDNVGTGLVALGYDFTANWGIEGLLAFFSTNFENDAQTPGVRVNGTLFNIDGVYHFQTQYAFQPYVLAGVGILGLSHNVNDANNSGNINAAVGLQYFINQTFSLRVEARDLYTWVASRNDILLSAGVSASFDFC